MVIKTRKMLALIAAGTVMASCGKTDDDAETASTETATPPSTVASGGGTSTTTAVVPVTSVGVTGQINLALGLAGEAADYEVAAFQMIDGLLTTNSEVKTFALEADGSFKAELPKNSGPQGYIRSDGTVDRSAILADHPEAAADLAAMTDDEVKEMLAKDGDRPQDTTWALVLRNKKVAATDKLAALERFINIDTDHGSLFGVRADDMTGGGSVGLGKIDAEGKAETDLADLATSFKDEKALATANEVARTNKALQALGNVYANNDAANHVSYEFTPFFTFSQPLAGVKNLAAAPSGFTYRDMGVYVTVEDVAHLTFDEICGTASKTLSLVPPGTVTFGTATFDATHPITNVGHTAIVERGTSNSATQECGNEGDSASGPLFVRHFGNEGDRFLFNTTVQGTPPPGVWKLMKDTAQVAQFTLSPASPLDAEGNPIVYIPQAKVDVNEAGKITGVHVDFYVLEAGAWKLVTDLEAMKKVVTSVSYGFFDADGKTSSPTSMEHYERLLFPTTGTTLSVSETDIGDAWYFSGTVNADEYVSSNLNVSYDMYGNRYRFDFN